MSLCLVLDTSGFSTSSLVAKLMTFFAIWTHTYSQSRRSMKR